MVQTDFNLDKTEHSFEGPNLKPPGAGLPLTQRLLLRYYVGPFVSAKTPWEESRQRFDKINQKILAMIDGLTNEQLFRKVLVPSIPGLEDSSRYWSIAMTLEHLAIVGHGISMIIEDLTQGRKPAVEIDIARLKPLGLQTPEQALETYKAFCFERIAKLDDNLGNINSEITKKHPWFGEMDAQQWMWLLASHHMIHYQQIKEIKKQLDFL